MDTAGIVSFIVTIVMLLSKTPFWAVLYSIRSRMSSLIGRNFVIRVNDKGKVDDADLWITDL